MGYKISICNKLELESKGASAMMMNSSQFTEAWWYHMNKTNAIEYMAWNIGKIFNEVGLDKLA